MNYQLPYPTGVDFYVQKLQNRLYPFLLSQWSMVDADYNCFGRAYRNSTTDGYIPEFYDPIQKAYVGSDGTSVQGGLFWQDTLKSMSFFGLVDPMKKNDGRDDVARMQLLFFIKLDKITAGAIPLTNTQGQRLDEVCVNDVKNFIQNNGCGFTVADTYKDVDKVLERYSGAQKRLSLKNDMHPNFCFRLDLELRYNPQLNLPIINN